ncbi:MAG: hypothetical protein P4L84_02475 [Isosphaeraceae bacterium]|nr:hypothetical protein [Isosphaeraceae bacterium]
MQVADSNHRTGRDAEIARVHDAIRWVLGAARVDQTATLEIFPERLLALRHAERLAPHVHELRLAPGTVVTPLARGELRRRGVAVRWVSRSEVEAVHSRGEWGFAIEGEGGVLTALRRTWLDDREPWCELAALTSAARWVAESTERGAIVVTDEAAVAVWRANQLAGVRAATAESSSGVARAVRGLGLNVLAIEPTGKPLPLVRQLAATFRSAGAPRIPAQLFEEAAPCVSRK